MNRVERDVRRHLESGGWTVLQKGWPDMLCVCFRNGKPELVAIEVKSNNYDVKQHQRDVLNCLATLMPVYIARESKNTRGFRLIKLDKPSSVELPQRSS